MRGEELKAIPRPILLEEGSVAAFAFFEMVQDLSDNARLGNECNDP